MASDQSLQLRAYLAFSHISEPIWRLALRRRLGRGKEDAARLLERLGTSFHPRPAGGLVWFHALSVGESLALLPLMERILELHPNVSVLLTTATRTSAQALARQDLPDRVIHQMLPIDAARPVRRFLEHWRPDLAIFAELDFWPALMAQTHVRDIPMALINSRMSEENYKKRKSGAGLFRDILGMFRVMLVQDDGTRQRFGLLGCEDDRISVLGSLKGAPRALSVDETELAETKSALSDRFVWLAASTEEREHNEIANAHLKVLARQPDALLILAPRHPGEADDIAGHLQAKKLHFTRRSLREVPTDTTQVILADTVGEMGLWYRLAQVTFMGHSLVTEGPALRGKNPFEAAALDTAMIHGPNVIDFEETYALFDSEGAAIRLARNEDLIDAIEALTSESARATQIEAARRVIGRTERVLDDTYSALAPLIPAG